ncbi:TIGR01777 family oxidoreductase [Rhodoluna lacicola]|uniref:TIGR01777 family protein n=1 Tax=Rhodoluna lacicola TaxID=529884 RepID=A0A060JD74_9MICO|nr:TIGR01777 family oxidoreductase [Rhodoluna lacicola]AIC47826.1 TIGR01777 family protein [Rhodoluna lacicola]
MRVLISGASGLVGSEVARQLNASGHEAIKLVRRKAAAADEVEWNPALGQIPGDLMDSIDAVVNMAGATTGKIPWTKKYKQEIVNSRIDSTRTLVKAMAAAKTPPKVFVSGSASGFYGDCGNQLLSETAPKGTGFLSDLANQWEQEALQAPKGVRVVLARTTMVMSKQLGALGRLLPLIKLGVGGPLGSGKQWWAWISQVDEAAAIIHLINTPTASGPFNLTAPQPATCKDIVVALAKQLGRPAIVPVPAFALKLFIGEAATELLLCSQNMSADKLLATGFKFSHAKLDEAAAWVVSK